MSNGKATIILLIIELIKKTQQKSVNIFQKRNLQEEKRKLNQIYATKADLKNAALVNTSKFAKKVDLASLKSNVHKLDIEKLKNVPSNLTNLKSKVYKIDVNK